MAEASYDHNMQICLRLTDYFNLILKLLLYIVTLPSRQTVKRQQLAFPTHTSG